MAKVRLIYKDFRPLVAGEAGYSKTKRLMVSPSSGEVISRRQFQNKAIRVGETPTSPATKGKQRKQRKDKGMIRSDYKIIRAELEAKKEYERRKLKLNKNTALQRYESAKNRHIDKLNKEREKQGRRELPYEYVPTEDNFYELYDIIKHPDNYSSEEIDDAMNYFWGDDYSAEYDYDYPLGDTP